MLEIRPAREEDADAIADLFLSVWKESLARYAPTAFMDRFTREGQREKYANRATDREWLLLVAEAYDQIYGMVGITRNETEPLQFSHQIKSMYVDPKHSRKGVGSALLYTAFGICASKRVTNLVLWCFADNIPACSFYEKHGAEKLAGVATPEEYSVAPHVAYAWSELPTR